MLQKTINITFILLLSIPAGLFWSDSSQASTPKQMYSQAEVCFKKLRHSPPKMKYRHNWLRCIDMFQKDPDDEPAETYRCNAASYGDISF